jgi:hypothetical protein
VPLLVGIQLEEFMSAQPGDYRRRGEDFRSRGHARSRMPWHGRIKAGLCLSPHNAMTNVTAGAEEASVPAGIRIVRHHTA